MKNEYIATYSRINELLKRHGFNMKKNFGQNFLIDLNILNKIVKTARVDEHTFAVEIGPGVGSLTQVLATHAKQVQCFEIDHKLEPLLQETLAEYKNVSINFSDFLKTDLTAWYGMLELAEDDEIKVVANLPYYITTPILEKLIVWYVKEDVKLTSATVMMQKEVARRLTAKLGTKEYGSLSIFIQLFSDPVYAFTVPKTVFVPAPNVDSAIVNLHFKRSEYFETYEAAEAFLAFVRRSFATRRKTLYNNLKELYSKEEILGALNKLELKETIRAEAVSIPEFLELFSYLQSK